MTIETRAVAGVASGILHHPAPEGITPSQTVGPFFHYALSPRDDGFPELVDNLMAPAETGGERLTLRGRVLDGDGEPVTDALLELWQADGEGRFSGAPGTFNAAFTGFGRCAVDADGVFSFDTVRPGAVPGPGGGMQAPHLDLGVFARGVLRRLFTRVYFDDEAANASDPILALVPQERRGTLIARRQGAGRPMSYAFDVRLQGVDETVFFTS